MERSRIVRIGLAASAAALLALGALSPSGLGDARGWDMLGMLREIGSTNEEIGQVNAGILTSLGNVRQQVEGVDRVQARLGAMEGLLLAQQAELDKLLTTTERQGQLSRELKELTASSAQATASMAQTASTEARTLERMHSATWRLAEQLQSIRSANLSTAAKLDRAEQLSATVLTRMP